MAALPSSVRADPGLLTPIEIDTQGNNFGYFEYLPADYEESTEWPVLIFLSGIGEFGTGELPPNGECTNGPNYSDPVLCRNLRHGPQNLIYNGQWDDVARPFVVIAPQNTAPLFSYNLYNPVALDTFVDYLIDTYAVDERRIYLTGMSMGGYSVTLAANYNPDRYAAIVTMPGINGIPVTDTCNVTRQAMWLFHGDNDGSPFEPSTMVRLANDFNGCEGPHPVARMTMYRNAGHNVWTRTIDAPRGMNDATYETWQLGNTTVELDPYDIDLYSWLLLHDKPDVDAGPDIYTGDDSVPLRATTIDDDPVAYAWRQLSGPTATLSNETSDAPLLTGLVDGTYVFEVEAVDTDGMWSTDQVTLTVEAGYVPPDPSGGDPDPSGGDPDPSGGDPDPSGGDPDPSGGDPDPSGGDPEPPVPEGCISSYDGNGDLAALSDEFDDPTSLECWRAYESLDEMGVPLDQVDIDIDVFNPSELTIEPYVSGGWFDDFTGPLVYKHVAGDFMLEVSVTVSNADGTWPFDPFNSAGIVVRDPANDAAENWIMWNVGNQFSAPGSEGKITIDSESALTLGGIGAAAGDPSSYIRLRVCRVGADFVLTHRLPGSDNFTLVHEYTHPALPERLHVGMGMTSWNGTTGYPNDAVVPDASARWQYARFSAISGLEACLDELPTCDDARRNQDETDIDCGGVCGGCIDGATCISDADCSFSSCSEGVCGGPVESCDDGLQNQGEAGIDCGGPCLEACATCDDGLRNQGEVGIDCGGPCPNACPSCFDGLLNQGEEDVDCGGPCIACDADASGILATVSAANAHWGTGYCARGSVTNSTDATTSAWYVVLDVGDSTLYSTWGGTYSATTGILELASAGGGGVLSPGQTREFGFCGLTPSGASPVVVTAGEP